MAKSKKRSSILSEIAYQLTMMIGVGVFLGVIVLVKEVDYIILFPLAALAAGGVMISFMLVFKLLLRPKPVVEATFEFDATKRNNRETASEFEYEVAGLINQITGKRTQVVGGAGDEGIDIKVLDKDDRLVGIVQCKKLSPKKAVYPAYIRDLNTVRHYHHINTAYLVSTGYFTEKSQELAKKLGVKLIDGKSLEKIRRRAIKID